MVKVINGEEYAWMKITIIKNGENIFYKFVNLTYWGIKKDDEESARGYIESTFNDDYMGYRGYSWNCELIDKPPREVIEKKIKGVEASIANLEKTKKVYEEYMESD